MHLPSDAQINRLVRILDPTLELCFAPQRRNTILPTHHQLRLGPVILFNHDGRLFFAVVGIANLDFPPGLVSDVGRRRLELPRRNPPLKQLVNLLQRATLKLRQEEEEEETTDEVGPCPDVAVLGSLLRRLIISKEKTQSPDVPS